MKKNAFTICAKNYIGLAQTLEKSIRSYSPDVDFFIFIADEFGPEDNVETLPDNVIITKDVVDISTDQWYSMCFKYELTEFCTAIKPSCFKYIFKHFNPDACIYFDPDILVFNSLDTIFEKLDKYSIMVTPHITTIEEVYTGSLSERKFFYSGMYNLGFLALKNDAASQKLLNWWVIRLADRCYQSMMENYFTDQKWIDFLPSFFPTQLLVSHDLGLNVAPWNFYEREVIVKDNRFFIKGRITREDDTIYPLTFVHFSGFDYKQLLKNEIKQGNIKDFEPPVDLEPVFKLYANKLRDGAIAKFINLGYSYNYFSNQVPVSMVYRRLFRRLLEDGKVDSDPFDTNESFYLELKKGGLIQKQMQSADKISVNNISGAEKKTLIINKVLYWCFKIIGAERFFLMVRLMRLYSKIENHVYLVDKSYLKRFKIWN